MHTNSIALTYFLCFWCYRLFNLVFGVILFGQHCWSVYGCDENMCKCEWVSEKVSSSRRVNVYSISNSRFIVSHNNANNNCNKILSLHKTLCSWVCISPCTYSCWASTFYLWWYLLKSPYICVYIYIDVCMCVYIFV